MDIAEHVEYIGIETGHVVERLDLTGPEAPVPTCPGWRMRDLATHVGTAHRWVAAIIERRAQGRGDVNGLEARGDLPPDDRLADWLIDGQRHLADVIASTPPDTDFWRMLRDAPSSLAFWARRQAHETAIHRVDAELAGDAVAPTDARPAFAADGVDELLLGFATRFQPTGIPPTTLQLFAPDIDRGWTVEIGEGRVDATGAIEGHADLRVDAPVNELYRLVWNRASPGRASLTGDPTVLDRWRAAVAI